MRRYYFSSFSILLWLSIALSGCSYDPVPINYGKDVCDNCRMQIEDRGCNAEIVSPKGKIYRFDSGECLLQFLPGQPFPADQARHLLMTDRSAPGNLIDARSAYYLISQQLPSPMGAGLALSVHRTVSGLFIAVTTAKCWIGRNCIFVSLSDKRFVPVRFVILTVLLMWVSQDAARLFALRREAHTDDCSRSCSCTWR